MIAISSECIAAVANAGSTWPMCWEALMAGRRPFQPVRSLICEWDFDDLVGGIDMWPHGPPPVKSRARELARWTAEQLRERLDGLRQDSECRIGLIVATSHSEAGAISHLADEVHGGALNLSADAAWNVLVENLVTAICEGMSMPFVGSCVSAACASALVATGLGRDYIQAGLYDACVVVSLDVLSRAAACGFRQIGAMSRSTCHPFDKNRDGITAGEAGVAYIISRSGLLGISGDVNIAGWGQHCDARHSVEPAAGGIVSAVSMALQEAQVDPDQIAGVYLHGSGTIQNDAAEAGAMLQIFGTRQPPASTTKATFGHCMGASGALNIAAACQSIRLGVMPYIAGLANPAFTQINLVSKRARRIARGPLLVIALGFGGINAAMVLSPNAYV